MLWSGSWQPTPERRENYSLPQIGSKPCSLSASAVVDSSILFSFTDIGCLEQLAVSFGGLALTPRLRDEVKKPKQKALVDRLVGQGLLVHLEPTVEESFLAVVVCEHSAYGKAVKDADREAIAVAKCRGMALLFEDTPMAKVARAAGIDQAEMFNTVRCLKKLVHDGILDEGAAQSHLAVINSQRTACRLRSLRWEEP